MTINNKSAIQFLTPYLAPYGWRLVCGFIFVILSILCQALLPLVLGQGIDYITAAADSASYAPPGWLDPILDVTDSPTQVLFTLATILIAAALFLGLFRITARILIVGVSRHVEYNMRNDYLAHLHTMSSYFYQEHKTGDLMAHATNDLNAIRQMTGAGIAQFLFTIVTFIFTLYFMFNLSVSLTLVSLLPLPFIIVIVYSTINRIHKTFDRIQEQFAAITSKVQENISGIRVIKSYVRESSEIRNFEKENSTYIDRNMALTRVHAFLHGSLDFLLGAGVIVLVWIGGRFIIAGKTSLGDLVAMLAYLNMLAWPMIAVGWLLNLWQKGLTATQRIEKIMKQQPDIADSPTTDHTISSLSGDVVFQDVSFTYPGADEPVLQNISLSIRHGTTLGIVGATGSGKSTLVNLIPRLIEPTVGRLTIDGHDIRQIPLKVLRQQIGYVQQESFLFSDTLAENISFAVVDAEGDIIANAIEVSQLKLDIDQFPDGLNTMIGERGITLSGGQKQRTSISRAIIHEPKILILDDALSSVDTYTEEEILNRIRPVIKERTTLIVAHRISTIRYADEIIVLHNGEIVEHGTHKDLLRRNGRYKDLYRRQQLEKSLDQLS